MRIGTGGALQLDFRALSATPTAAELRDFRHTQVRPPQYPSRWARTSDAIGRVLAFGVVLLLASLLVVMLGTIGVVTLITGEGERPWAMLAGAVVVGGLTIVPPALLLRKAIRRLRPLPHWYRMHHFAAANGLDYRAEVPKPGLPGSAFRVNGEDRVITDLFSTRDGRPVQFGNYRAEIGSWAAPRRVRIGFIRMMLDHPMPHFVLFGGGGLGKVADPLSGLFGRRQAVSLEGDFDRHFRVFAPEGYGADVRFVLTPDFMAALVDGAQGFDIEMIDRDLYLYAPAPFDFEQFPTHARIRHTLEVIGSRTLRRTRGFTDDRVAEPRSGSVAPQGRRMRWAIPITGLLLGLVWVTWQVLTLTTPL